MSPSAHFSLRGQTSKDEPMFIQGQPGISSLSLGREPLSVSHVTKQLLEIAREVGLDSGSVYAFRHDMGDEMHSLYNAETARAVLGHLA